jgi:TorA maturation chaperone TorD
MGCRHHRRFAQRVEQKVARQAHLAAWCERLRDGLHTHAQDGVYSAVIRLMEQSSDHPFLSPAA